MFVSPQQAEALEELALHLRHATGGVLLVAAASDAENQRVLTQALVGRLADEMTFPSFRFSPNRLSLAAHLRSLPRPATPAVLLVEGLDELPDEAREWVLASLNLERETLRWAGYSILLWVRPRTLTELPFKAGDFWAWRSGSFLFDETVLSAVAPERVPPPEEVADLRARAENYRRDLARPGLGPRARARVERELALVQRQLSLVALREAATAQADRARLRAAYCTHLVNSFRWLDVRGILQTRKPILLPLEEVFVALHTVPQERAEERHAAAEFALQVAEERASYETERRLSEKTRWEIRDALAEHHHLVVLGDPGSGKTTLLKYLALTVAEGPEVAQARLGLEEEPPLPIILSLSAFAAALTQEPDLSLDEYMPRHFVALELPGLGGLFAEELAAGRCLVLLDGLDEVPTRQQRRRVVRRVDDFVVHHQANRFVVTSRIVGYREEPLGEELAHFTIVDWGDQEIAEFARRWCVAYECQANDSLEAVRRGQDEAERLIGAIQSNPSVRRLASNPLLLTIIALIHRQGTRLPQHRIQLYGLTFQTLIETWNRARNLEGRPLSAEGMSEHEAVQILAPLALWMHETQPSGTARREEVRTQIAALLEEEELERAREAADRFLDLVRRQVGLLVERGAGLFGFMHLTFEEYLAARAIVMAGQVDLQRTIEHVLRHLEEPAWHEVVRLAVGQLGVVEARRQAAAAVVEAILDAPGHSQARGQHAALAGWCLVDVGEKGVTRACWRRVTVALQRMMQDTAPDGRPNAPPLVPIPTRYAAGEVLDRLGWLPPDLDTWVEVGIPNPKPQDPNRVYVARYPVTNAQFFLFKEAGGYENPKYWGGDKSDAWRWRTGKPRYSWQRTDAPDRWDDPRFGKGRRGYPVVGVSWYEANAYCVWLTELLGQLRKGRRLPTAHRELVAHLPPGVVVMWLPAEAEWEAAAGGAEGERYPWGPEWHKSHANTWEAGIRGTTPVGMYLSGQSPAGVWDMGGNIWEWMASDEEIKPLRGGSWYYDQKIARVRGRFRLGPDFSDDGIGFRVVASPAGSDS